MKKLFFILTVCANNYSLIASEITYLSPTHLTGPLAERCSRTSSGQTSVSSSPRTPRVSMTLVLPREQIPKEYPASAKIGFNTAAPMTPPSSTSNSPRTPDVQEFAVTPPTPKSTTASTYFKHLNTLTRDRYKTHSQALTSLEIGALKVLGGSSVSTHQALLELADNFALEGREDFLVWLAHNAPADKDAFRASLSNPTNQTAIWETLRTRYNTEHGNACDLSDLAQSVYSWPCEADLTEEQVTSAFEKRTDPRLIAAELRETKKHTTPDGIRVSSATDGEIYYHLRGW